MTKPKYTRGRAVTDTGEAVNMILGGHLFYLGHGGRPKHQGFLTSMMIHTIDTYCRTGTLILALPIEDTQKGRKT